MLDLLPAVLVAAIPALPYLIAFGVFVVGAIAVPLIFGYSLVEAKKFLASWAFAVGGGAALFITGYDPNLTEAVALLAGSVLSVVEVFSQPRASEADFSKTFGQLRGAVLSVVSFFAVVPASTEAHIAVVVGAIVSILTVRQLRNEPVPV